MTVDNTYQPAVYKEQGGNKMVVKAAGSIENAGTITIASGGALTVASGATITLASGSTIAGIAPRVPSGDGDYVLHIASGVATWVAAS